MELRPKRFNGFPSDASGEKLNYLGLNSMAQKKPAALQRAFQRFVTLLGFKPKTS